MNTTSITDAALITRYLSGDVSAFEQLVIRYKDKAFTTIVLIVKDRYLAQDLLQDTFIKAIHTLQEGRYNEEGRFGSWLCRIAHNQAIDYFRKEKRKPTITLEDGSDVFNALCFSESSAESVQIVDETHQQLKILIDQLPPAQREVLIMRHYADMSFQEIADATGVSINTALGRMRYALLNLRKHLNPNQSQYDKNFYTGGADPVHLQ